MSEKPISVGDLVMVVRPLECCGSTSKIGRIFTVGAIGTWDTVCPVCKTENAGGLRAEPKGSPNKAVLISRLKRLDPDALKDDVPTKEEIEA